MKFFRFVIVLAATMSIFLVNPAQAEAKPARVPWNKVYVEVATNLPSSWSVSGAVADVDWYTGTAIKVVPGCSGKYDCVEVRGGKVTGSPVGYFHSCVNHYDSFTDKTPRVTCKITVDTAKASKAGTYNTATKRWLVRHELGHWRGLDHRSKCDSTMYQYTRCSGKIPPNAFTSTEQSILRKH